ncbi:ankyrin repeat-containing protein [Seiridium cupressi]
MSAPPLKPGNLEDENINKRNYKTVNEGGGEAKGLIDAHKLEIKEFTGHPPQYVILSDRWGRVDEEVAYHEFHCPGVTTRPGHNKIKNCCSQSIAILHYVWVDTCCIDKLSSAELSEAINSMFNWYHNSVISYTFFEDARGTEKPASPGSEFGESAWFARDRTLQERWPHTNAKTGKVGSSM